MARRTSCPRARRASGSEPATSASPHTLTNGAASAARNRTFTAADYDRLPPFGPRKRLLGRRCADRRRSRASARDVLGGFFPGGGLRGGGLESGACFGEEE